VFAAAAIVVCVAIAVTAFRVRPTLHAVALGLILGGAFGNLLNRILRGPGLSGRVIDFIDPHVWPVFNLADAAVVSGAVLLALQSFREGRSAPEAAADA
jgi:signal peptidase II